MATCFFGWLNKERDFHSYPPHIPEHPCIDPSHTLAGANHCLIHSDANIYSDEKISIAYSGNFYWSDQETQTIAEKQGNGRAIHAAYVKRGKSFLNQIRGSFSISLVEPVNNYILLAIDRMGIQRLLYQDREGFAFSNSLKTLNLYTGGRPEIAMQSVYNYLYFHMIPSPDSIYEGIKKVEPGHYVEYCNGATSQHLYWKPDFAKNNNDNPKQTSERLHHLLTQAIDRRITPDVGAFLSGGLDSSSVAGFLSKSLPQAKTFSIGFDAKGYDETEYARTASSHFDTQHHEYYVTPDDVLNIVPKIAQAYDEPFGNSSAIPAYYCAKMAKEHGCQTLLAGDGGDELFGGNERYVKQKLFENYLKLPKFAKKINRTLFNNAGLQKIPGSRKMQSFIRQAHTPLPDRMENYNFLHQMDPESIFSDGLLEATNTNYPIQLLRQRYQEPETADFLDRMLYLDWKRTLADNDIRKVNEMCQLAGLEVDYPMLDDELVDFSCSINSELKIKGMKIRHFYKRAMNGFLPDQIINKSKHGFGLPFGVWMKTNMELQSMAYDAITQLKQQNLFKPEFLDNAIDMHRSGHASYYGELIWVLMMLSIWLEKHA